MTRLPLIRMAAFTAVTAALASVGQQLSAGALDAQAIRRQALAKTNCFHDLSMKVHIAYYNPAALAAIGTDYAKAYKFRESSLAFKAPGMFKMTSRAGITQVSYVIKSNKKTIRAGLIKKSEDISDDPHKRQTVLDVGLFSSLIWQEFDVTAARLDTYNGRKAYLFELRLRNSPQKKQLIWVDAADFRLWKREKFEEDGSLRVRYVYGNHTRFNDCVWVPSQMKVYNGKGELAGISLYGNIRINAGLPDSIFR